MINVGNKSDESVAKFKHLGMTLETEICLC